MAASGAVDAPRALFVSHTGLASGAETVLVRFVDAATAAGWDVTCAIPDGPLVDRISSLGARRVAIPELKLPGGPRAIAALRLAARSVGAARRLRRCSREADAIVSNGLLALPALRLARPRPPVAWLVHDLIWRRQARALLALSSGVVDVAWAVSDAVAASVQAVAEVRVVRNGTPWPVDPAAPDPTAPPIVGCAAMLTSWKGQDVLLEAVAALDRDVVLELAGGHFPKDGPFVERLRQRAAQPDLAGRVRFLGHVPEVQERIRQWTIAVLPSVDPEAAPLSLLEYMSLGVPAVATDHGGAPEVLGEAGLLVPPGDAGALADAIQRLLGDDALRRRCGESGRNQIERSLTLGHHRADLLAALTTLRDKNSLKAV